jgi:hypothetical protein
VLAALSGCAGQLPPPVLVSAVQQPALVQLSLVPETQFHGPWAPPAEGPLLMRAIYDRHGQGQGLDICRRDQERLYCHHHAVTLPGARGPLLVKAWGRIEGGSLLVTAWEPLAWYEATSQAMASAALASQTDLLGNLAWERLARADFAESSGRYTWQPAAIVSSPVELYGYDMGSQRIIWRAQGPPLPQQKPLVTRFPAIYAFVDPAGQQAVDMIVTIEGFVTE